MDALGYKPNILLYSYSFFTELGFFFFFETFAPPIYIHMFQKIEILSPDPGVVLIGLKKSFPIIALLIFGAG